MKVLIGITQSPEESEAVLCQEPSISGTRTFVGPFRSSEDASDWVEFMMTRREGYEIVPPPQSGSLNGKAWFGFTFEHIKQQAH